MSPSTPQMAKVEEKEQQLTNTLYFNGNAVSTFSPPPLHSALLTAPELPGQPALEEAFGHDDFSKSSLAEMTMPTCDIAIFFLHEEMNLSNTWNGSATEACSIRPWRERSSQRVAPELPLQNFCYCRNESAVMKAVASLCSSNESV